MADPTPEELAAQRPPPAPTPSEKEAYEGKIKLLTEENEQLKKEIEDLRETYDFTPKKKTETKKKSFLGRFSPLD